MAKLLKSRVLAGVRARRPAWLAACLPILLPAIAMLVHPEPALSQGLTSEIIYTRQPAFRIPFETEAGQQRIQQVQLYFSINQGVNWQPAGTSTPDQRGFNFRANQDGLYWFAVRTLDFQNRVNPARIEELRPQLKVYVDTQPPLVNLRQGSSANGAVSVEWDIREDNLDLSSFNLEYRSPGNPNWIPLPVVGGLTGQRSWDPGANGAIEVRLRVRDLAKNDAEAKLTIMPGGQVNPPANNAAAQPATQPAVRYVNSKTIKLNYQIAERGPSGVSAVELWFTRDGRTWAKLDEKTDNPEPPYVHTLADDGLYGFIILPLSGVGFKDREPRTGDPPQIWVEVDVTKPEISWINVDVGRGQDVGKVFITWKATDKNLGREPVKLSYAENLTSQWTAITPTPLPNTGRYEWTMPSGVPVKFYVRIEVTDKAGNTAQLDYTKPVIVDLKIPKGIIVDAEPASKP